MRQLVLLLILLLIFSSTLDHHDGLRIFTQLKYSNIIPKSVEKHVHLYISMSLKTNETRLHDSFEHVTEIAMFIKIFYLNICILNGTCGDVYRSD